MNENKPFLLDELPVSAKELIEKAEYLYGCQSGESLRLTSTAAICLRRNGHRVIDK